MEYIICIILFLCVIGFGFYIAGKSLSKKTKVFDLSFGKNGWFKIHSEFYKNNGFFFLNSEYEFVKSGRVVSSGRQKGCALSKHILFVLSLLIQSTSSQAFQEMLHKTV